jgi:hypothetical protein
MERELGVLRFQGVISLQTENGSSDFIASTKSIILNLALVQPAMQATQQFLPGSVATAGQDAGLRRALPNASLPDFLTATDELVPTPFELHLVIPRQAPKPAQIHGTVGALKSVLDSYRSLLSISQNI